MVPADGRNGVVGKPVFNCVGGEPLVLIAGQAVGRADPQSAVGAGGEGGNRITRQITVAFVKDDELVAVEPREPFIGSEPEVSVSRLGDGTDGVLWQPLFLRPGGSRVLCELFPRIQRGGPVGAETHHERHHNRVQIAPE